MREIEDGIVRDFSDRMSYGSYLDLDTLFSAQHPRSDPPHHDELLFIIQHQTSELWLHLTVHELRDVTEQLKQDRLDVAMKRLARVKHIQETLTQQWSVLATLTPTEYAQFRGALANSSGFQSVNYRAVEFLLGNKHEGMLAIHEADPEGHALLSELLVEPSVYDEFLRYLARRGMPIPQEILDRDVSQPWEFNADLVTVLRDVYENVEENWDVYEALEELVDLEDNFQFWRFRHLRTVQRTIGFKHGTGGSSGVGFLKKALDLTFFPELYAVRTEVRDA
ncbi:tryptophan 2,3-dioxygenase family protein [Nocardiopsis tropica]|uniref:Tryptophan 2,3-dioxygenase n=2 Tax=Tsukamurellaceae TaxID=85028 RepID=A0AA90S818_9ACTN|nr:MULTISPECIES: tryptophan 2,3-dioxygenase [Tsukamurella]MDP0398240.1 tryptophan 2,3-dioxygenase [Tsukamurella strandjordii]GIZ97927.1 tryptophan 2,3-dioxygenase [Tsukamurella sp. TY48]